MDGQWRPMSQGSPRGFRRKLEGFCFQGFQVEGLQASYPAVPALSRQPAITLECFCLIRSLGPSRNTRVDRQGAPAIFRPLRDTGLWAVPCECPCGGIGRRARLKIEFRKECWFDSGQGHQLGCSSSFQSVRNRPRSARKPLKNRLFRVHRCSSPFVLIRSQPSDLLVFLLVSGGRRVENNPILSIGSKSHSIPSLGANKSRAWTRKHPGP